MSQTQSESECEGFVFRFELPKDGLTLRSVHLEDGEPELRFDASPNVPTLTEEDVAVVIRLVLEGKRPQFFYKAFPPDHPFFGRQYMHYEPQWLRGTSVGELLAEVDWQMKCLHIGARSDESKSHFWAWQKTSQLQGLKTSLDFLPGDTDLLGGSIRMSCVGAKVQNDCSSLMFPEEPTMQIVDESNTVYSNYITENFASIAFFDEPLFLKMQELVKLILSMEWLLKKGVTVNQQWLNELTQPKLMPPTDVKMAKSEITEADAIHCLPHMQNCHQEVISPVLGRISVDFKVEKTVSENGIEFIYKKVIQPSGPISKPRLEQITQVKMTSNHYDWLYSDMDPKQPLYSSNIGTIIPSVQTWNELFLQTVPWPHVWKYPYDRKKEISSTGGVSMENIPVTEVEPMQIDSTERKMPTRVRTHKKTSADQYTKYPDRRQIGVRATKYNKRATPKKAPQEMIPEPTTICKGTVPSCDVTVKTIESKSAPHEYGYHDFGSGETVRYKEDGTLSYKQKACRSSIEQTLKVNGELDIHIKLQHLSGLNVLIKPHSGQCKRTETSQIVIDLPDFKEIGMTQTQQSNTPMDTCDPPIHQMNQDALCIKDLKVVRQAIWDARNKWYDLGLELDIHDPTLEEIKADHSEVKECFTAVIKEWLKKSINPKATWRKLVEALKSPPVDEPQLAEDVTKKYCPAF